MLYVDDPDRPRHRQHPAAGKTMDAFRDHGHVSREPDEGVAEAEHDLAEAGRARDSISRAVTDALVVEGVDLFAKAFDELLKAVADKRAQMAGAA